MYFILGFWSGLVGTSLSVIVRFELMKPGLLYRGGQLYNSVITAHALMIIFFIVMPTMIGGFGNWLIPIMLGSPDIRFPRLNNLRFWFLPVSLTFILMTMLLDVGAGTS